ncbi:uncharacterized protein [Aegilops tauschii subsp. strangulata]|uniref:uncharacterized protein isoform X2 n=1 Tax=Aegilops tauschii subsp. strangulata TaxID=200361 RepID=UPI003CC8A90A
MVTAKLEWRSGFMAPKLVLGAAAKTPQSCPTLPRAMEEVMYEEPVKAFDGKRQNLKTSSGKILKAGDDNHLDEPRHDLYYEAQSFSDILDNE